MMISSKTKQYKQGDTSADDIHDFMWKSPREDITENIIKTKIPYAEIGTASGQTIRIVIEEKIRTIQKKAIFRTYFLNLNNAIYA